MSELKECPFCTQKTKHHGGFDYHHSEFLKGGEEVVRVFTTNDFPKGMNAVLTDDVSDAEHNCGNIKTLEAKLQVAETQRGELAMLMQSMIVHKRSKTIMDKASEYLVRKNLVAPLTRTEALANCKEGA